MTLSSSWRATPGRWSSSSTPIRGLSRASTNISSSGLHREQLWPYSRCSAGKKQLPCRRRRKRREELFTQLAEQRGDNFGNRRDVRNCFEDMIVRQSTAWAQMAAPTKDDLMAILPEDMRDESCTRRGGQRRRRGRRRRRGIRKIKSIEAGKNARWKRRAIAKKWPRHFSRVLRLCCPLIADDSTSA